MASLDIDNNDNNNTNNHNYYCYYTYNNRTEKYKIRNFEKPGKVNNFEKVIYFDAQTAILKELRAVEGATS